MISLIPKLIITLTYLQYLIQRVSGQDIILTQVEQQLLMQGVELQNYSSQKLSPFIFTKPYQYIALNLALTENIHNLGISFDTNWLILNKLIISNMNITYSDMDMLVFGFISLSNPSDYGNNTLWISQLIIENSFIEFSIFESNGYIDNLLIGELVIINSKFSNSFLKSSGNMTILDFQIDLNTMRLSQASPVVLMNHYTLINHTKIPHSYHKQYPYTTDFLNEIEQTLKVKLINHNSQSFLIDESQQYSQRTLIQNESQQQLYIQQAEVDFQGNYFRFLSSYPGAIQVVVKDSVFKNMNAYKDGGAILNKSQQFYLENTIFLNCTSQRFGGALMVYKYMIWNATFMNCSSKIGGAIFTAEDLNRQSQMINITYTNNTALVAGNDLFIANFTRTRFFNQEFQQINFFTFDRVIQYNNDLKGTHLEQVEVTDLRRSNNMNFVTFGITQGFTYLFLFNYTQINQTEFPNDQALGNLYDLVDPGAKIAYATQEIDSVQQPYLVFQSASNIDCDNTNEFQLFNYFGAPETIQVTYGCPFIEFDCSSSMIVKQTGLGCSYCALGTFTHDQKNCITCNNKLYDQCYANVSTLKSSLWRSSLSDSDSSLYPCNLNPESCEGKNRNGFGNDLCSEGYIGIQCSSCDINRVYWKESYGETGQFQCVRCDQFVKNKKAFLIVSMCFTIILLVFTLVSNSKRMQRQVMRRILSKMEAIYIGTSFLRRSQMAVYIKILLFNFQIYLTSYYFVNFNKSDSLSFHSQFYSFFNPLQNSSSNSLQCLMKEYFPESDNLFLLKLKITVLLPLAVNLAVLLVLPPVIFLFKLKWSTVIYVGTHCLGYTVFFVWMQPIIQQSIAANQCIQLTTDSQYLILDREINCDDSTKMNQFRLFSIPALVIYAIVIPLIFFLSLFTQRKNLEKIRVLRLLGFLYDEYKRKYYYWQFIKIFLSQLLTSILQLSQTRAIFAGQVYCGLLVVYLIMLIIFQPFQQLIINKTEMISIVLSILYLLSSLSLETIYDTEDSYEINQVSQKIANVFYYSVLVCLATFYLYMAIVICSFFFYISSIKLQRFRIFGCLTRYLPQLFAVQNFTRLKVNLAKWRTQVKHIQIGEMKILSESDIYSTSSNQLIARNNTVN